MRFLALSFFLFFTSLSVFAQTEFKVPALTGPVIDEVGFLNRSDRQDLMQLLYDFNRRGKAQVQVLIVPDLQGLPIEQASIQITDKWQLGDKKKDNGVLFLISAQERAMRIEVGQGLEGAIPDITAKRIISDQVIPLFRSKRYSTGIVIGVHEILRLADKEFADENNLQDSESKGGDIPVFVIIALLIIISILGRFGGGRGRFYRGGGGGWGGGYGGGGWSSGGGGGGWSGGGGGFSGGGASGNW
ncbi:TPM domain-containing protein [uncultured Bdellovibrio sp.]|uniref:TPM domain-containing protein n=1 Tax=Bdellovibrio sp. HCB-162 TaxID=3394234 RepID=UPI0025E86820|nr:TPM domain-containing protein [uncultured Bdellovibrio sp.]